MVTRRHAFKARRDRNRPSSASASRQNQPDHKKHASENVYGVPVPESLHEAIELERENLSKVESILACMVASMECDADAVSGPYYPDVAQIARELVERSIDRLDSFNLKRRLLNKVEEVLRMSFVDHTYLLLHRPDSRQALIGSSPNC